MNSESGIRAMGEVVMNLVWKHLLRGPRAGEDALHVHDNGLAGAGQNHVLLIQEVTGHGDAVTHGDFVGGAAHTGNGDALAPTDLA